jgi:hypothetical protein
MKIVIKHIVGLLTALIIMLCFILGCSALSVDYNEFKFLAGWVSCMGYNIAIKICENMDS